MRNEMNEPTAIPTTVKPNDTSKRQYGTVLVYGSTLEFAGGSVVQNAEIVVSSKAAYKKPKCKRSNLPFGQEKLAPRR